MRVSDAMELGASRYQDALSAIQDVGLAANFTQTGGMCAAIEARLERGYLLVTDTDDSLPWDRSELQGWGVGFYDSEDVSDGPLHFEATDDPSTESLRATIRCCMNEILRQLS